MPDSPSGFGIEDSRTTSSMTITWTDPKEDFVTHFDVCVSEDDDEASVGDTVYNSSGEGIWKVDISNLPVSGRKYGITVTSYNGDLEGEPNWTSERTSECEVDNFNTVD